MLRDAHLETPVPEQIRQHNEMKARRARMGSMTPVRRLVVRVVGNLPAAAPRVLQREQSEAKLQGKRKELETKLTRGIIKQIHKNSTSSRTWEEYVAEMREIARLKALRAQAERLEHGRAYDDLISEKANRIVADVMHKYGIKSKKLFLARPTGSYQNCRDIIRPSQEAAWRIRRDTDLPLTAIGKILGGRDHSTIIKGIRKFQSQIDRGIVERPAPYMEI